MGDKCKTPRRFTSSKNPVRVLQEVVRSPGLVWKEEENLAPKRDLIPGTSSL